MTSNRSGAASRATPRVAVVAAGAGARGAYEAGALSVLIPWLCDHGKRPSVFVGTSAGAINAALFAAVAHLDAREGAELVLEAWRSLSLHKVFRSPLASVPLRTGPDYLGQMLGRGHVASVLDTTPMRATAEGLFRRYAQDLHNNIHGAEPLVAALAVAASDDRGRTTVFADVREGLELPDTDQRRAIDYRRAGIGVDHVLASSAIPALFSPIEIDGRWYMDGGVRLNVPLKPAIELGATELAVVATHPATYEGAEPPPSGPARTHDLVDGVVAVLGAVLADRMVEDLHTLEKVNELVRRGGAQEDHREIPYMFVGPDTRHEIGERAAHVYRAHFAGINVLHGFDLRLLHRLIGPREDGGGDLLSYLFFDRSFTDDAIALGIRHAVRVVGAVGQPPDVGAVTAATGSPSQAPS